jgi:rRNA maturation endonuclease Nob1
MKICLACGKSFEADDFCCPVCGHSPPAGGSLLLIARKISGFVS